MRAPALGGHHDMRSIRVILVLVLACGAMLSFWWGQRTYQNVEDSIRDTRRAVDIISREIRVRSFSDNTIINERGWPITIDPSWFTQEIPQNHLLDPHRLWLEIATGRQLELEHPPVRWVVDERSSAFWYNPANGILRARVPVSVSDRKALDQYNRINRSDITALIEPLPPEEPAPALALEEPGEDVIIRPSRER